MQNVDLNEITIFIKVVQAGSFTKAAKSEGIPISTVSARVQSLEKRLGITLLQRTTRQLRLTQSGEQYYNQALAGLEEIYQAESNLLDAQREPQGEIKITAPIFLGNSLLPRIISECLKQYPKIKIEVILKDQEIDLISAGVDVAIRAGDLKDSSLISKRLGHVHFAPFATKTYLKNKEKIRHPKDIIEHSCVQFSGVGQQKWEFTNARSKVSVPMEHKVISDDLNFVRTLTLNNLGVALLPTFVCDLDVKAGKLVRVLPEWKSITKPIHLLYTPQKFPSPKMRAFLEIAFSSIKSQLEGTECESI